MYPKEVLELGGPLSGIGNNLQQPYHIVAVRLEAGAGDCETNHFREVEMVVISSSSIILLRNFNIII